MVQVISATFEDGVFKPDQRPALAESARVRLFVEAIGNDVDAARREQAWGALEQLWQESTFDSQGDRMTRDELHERS